MQQVSKLSLSVNPCGTNLFSFALCQFCFDTVEIHPLPVPSYLAPKYKEIQWNTPKYTRSANPNLVLTQLKYTRSPLFSYVSAILSRVPVCKDWAYTALLLIRTAFVTLTPLKILCSKWYHFIIPGVSVHICTILCSLVQILLRPSWNAPVHRSA